MKAARPPLVGVALLAVLGGCVAGPAGGAAESPAVTPTAPESPTMTARAATPTPPARVTAADRPHVPATCRLAKPTRPFLPPARYPSRPPAHYGAEWYGTARLWTMLQRDSEVWYSHPRGPGGFGQKTFWWSVEWKVANELQPAITVTGRRLDGPGGFTSPGPGTNAGADFGTAMLIGVAIPTTGCWRITAIYRGATLSYVAWVGD